MLVPNPPLETTEYYTMKSELEECFSWLATRHLLWGELSNFHLLGGFRQLNHRHLFQAKIDSLLPSWGGRGEWGWAVYISIYKMFLYKNVYKKIYFCIELYMIYIFYIYFLKKSTCPSGQKCMTIGKPCSTGNSGVTLTAKKMDSAQVKAEFGLKLTIPDGPTGPEALFIWLVISCGVEVI